MKKHVNRCFDIVILKFWWNMSRVDLGKTVHWTELNQSSSSVVHLTSSVVLFKCGVSHYYHIILKYGSVVVCHHIQLLIRIKLNEVLIYLNNIVVSLLTAISNAYHLFTLVCLTPHLAHFLFSELFLLHFALRFSLMIIIIYSLYILNNKIVILPL